MVKDAKPLSVKSESKVGSVKSEQFRIKPEPVKSENVSPNNDKKRPAMDIIILDSDDEDDDSEILGTGPVFGSSKKKKESLEPSPPIPSFVKPDPGATSAKQKRASVSKVSTFVGTFESTIVGVGHYQGFIPPCTNCNLVRAPNNLHDPNAIKVVGTDGSTKGHIPRQVAVILAPIMDQGGLVLTALTKATLSTEFSVSITVTIWAESYCPLSSSEIIAKTKELDPMLRRLAWKPKGRPEVDASLKAKIHARPTSFPSGAVDTVDGDYDDFSDHEGTGKHSEPLPPLLPAEVVRGTVDTSEVNNGKLDEEQLDRMFELLQAGQLKDLPKIAMPAQLASMKLYDFQKNGIKWLYKQETEGKISPFFAKTGDHWSCTISQCKLPKGNSPKPIRGAVLADDMGLVSCVHDSAVV